MLQPGKKNKPEETGAPIVVVLPGSAQPKDNYSQISEALAFRGFFVMVVEQLVDILVPDDPRIHFSNFSDVNLIPASVIPQALAWIKAEYASGSSEMIPCATPNQDSVSLVGHALGARAVRPPSPALITALIPTAALNHVFYSLSIKPYLFQIENAHALRARSRHGVSATLLMTNAFTPEE